MSIPKRHHVLPAFYLDGFTRDGFVVVFDRERKQYRRQKPLNTAVIRHYYTFTNRDGKADTSLETMLSQFEGWASAAFQKLAAQLPLTTEERVRVAYFIALLHVRTPRFEREVLSLADAAAKLHLRSSLPNVDSVVAHFEELGHEAPGSAEEFLQFVHSDEYEIAPDRDNTIHTMLDLAPSIGDKLAHMDWTVVHATATESFITSDSPVGFLPVAGHQLVRGIGSPNAIKVIPMSAERALLIGSEGVALEHQHATPDVMHELNVAIASECEGYVIACNEHVLRVAVEACGLNESLPGPTITVENIPDPREAGSVLTLLRRVNPNQK